MATPARSPQSPSPPPVPYGSDAYEHALAALGNPPEHACVLLAGAPDAEKLEALAALAGSTSLNLHQIDLAALLGETDLQTQGNLREVFDNTLDGTTLLFFDNADAFFEAVARDGAARDLDPDALTPVDYFFQRAHAFKGAVVLRLTDPAHIERARAFHCTLTVAW